MQVPLRRLLSLLNFRTSRTKMSTTSSNPEIILYPAAERNKGHILEVLQGLFASHRPPVKSVLEVGCGSGQHSAHFAAALPHINFTPSDFDGQLFENIALLRNQLKLTNLGEPFLLDLTWPPEQWPISSPPDVIYASNILHISPWECSEGLFAGAGHHLLPGGLLVLYGPFAVDGVLSPASNVQFDRSLRARDSRWGVRDMTDLKRLAMENRLLHKATFEMPANNKVLVFSRQPS